MFVLLIVYCFAKMYDVYCISNHKIDLWVQTIHIQMEILHLGTSNVWVYDALIFINGQWAACIHVSIYLYFFV